MKLHQKMPFLDLCLTCFSILLVCGCVNCKWCTRITSEKHIFTSLEPSQCLKTYESYCGWFTTKTCTFYEMAPCFKELNHTVVQYKIVEECCPGFQLDPVRNDTCIAQPDNEPGLDKVTNDSSFDTFIKLSPLDEVSNITRQTVRKTIGIFKFISIFVVHRQNYTVQYYKSQDGLLFGLSQGAYAGIICAFLFICCVITLITLHAVKRSLRNSAVKANQGMEQEMVEKMIQTPQT